jgi:hypothetical protein
MSILRRITIGSEILKSKLEGIEHFLDSIDKWKKLAYQELKDLGKRLEDNEDSHEYDWDNIGNEAYMVEKTEMLMYANIAVSLFAVAENFLRILCLNLDGTEVYRQIRAMDRPNWGNVRNALEQNCNIKYDEIENFEAIDKVRILNNCFKHNSGRPNDEYIKKYDGDCIEEIAYEKEDWSTTVSECKNFLLILTNQVSDAVKMELNI